MSLKLSVVLDTAAIVDASHLGLCSFIGSTKHRCCDNEPRIVESRRGPFRTRYTNRVVHTFQLIPAETLDNAMNPDHIDGIRGVNRSSTGIGVLGK